MQVELYTQQIYEDHKQAETILYQGNLVTAPKGSVLEFGDVNNQYQMTILENKILLKKQNQLMVFELGRTTSSELQTQYGNINMKITTNHIEVIKEKEKIQKIMLHYDITLEGTTKYQNQIEIVVK